MTPDASARPARIIADALRERRHEITARWLERVVARVSLDPERVFPSDQLLDHVPILIEGIADFIADPAEDIGADPPVIAKAMELGELRFSQGFDAAEILKEFEILGGILHHEAAEAVQAAGVPVSGVEVLACAQRIFRAIAAVQQVTTSQYLRVLTERVAEREERLRRFNRMLTHELKNRVGAVTGAGQLLQEDWLPEAERRKFAAIVTDNALSIQKVLENLVALSRLHEDRRRQKNVELPEAVEEVLRQLRALARARNVRVLVPHPLPEVQVNAAAVELCLSNYVSNAVKYADPRRSDRWARIEATVNPSSASPAGLELIVRVRDNGLGVPEEQRHRLFERFFRGEHAGIEGTGLGLSLVQETAESFGGRAWAEFDAEQGTSFLFTLPCRRVEDRQSIREVA